MIKLMNYLAHLFFAEDDPDSIVGSLMGDFVKGRVPDDLPPKLRAGILLHRRIDSYTDAHPIFSRSRRRLRPQLRRYGGILVDIFYDHYLARDWERYADVALASFSRSVYRILIDCMPQMPPRMQRSVGYMIEHDLLMSYRGLGGIARALRGIERRLKRESDLSAGVVDLERDYGAFREDFEDFFPRLIAFARDCPGAHR
jgi:acyl carrier protein phosphodiesterase